MTFSTYTWRGKTYKTLSGLCRAVMKVHANGAISFGEHEMHVRIMNTRATVVYDVTRTPDNNLVADHAKDIKVQA